jgi:methylated-DNA-[protein]-cysteine S-methyltransferase
MLTVTTMRSPLGTLRLYADDDQLVGLYLAGEPANPGEPVHAAARRRCAVLDHAVAQLAEYFEGRRRVFSIRLAPRGTSFQRLVWTALMRIPCGKTRSYSELARAIGRPTAIRAVGAANGRNPISIIVPCHRLIGADGDLTGYGGGLPAKRWLLDHERATAASARTARQRPGDERR